MATSLLQLVLPRTRGNDRGAAATSTFNPSQTQNVISAPAYRDHTIDLFASRIADDSRALLKSLFKADPDVSGAVNAYIAIADVAPWWICRDSMGVISREGHFAVEQTLLALTTRFDYTKPSGFQLKQGLRTIFNDFRYMLLLRGGIAAELVLSKTLLPSELRQVDLAGIQWKETAPGVYKPQQPVQGQNDPINLDIPNFFVSFFRRDPTEIYPTPFFTAAINTIAARQQVINDLYRIMRVTGYPRLEISVLEKVLRENAPAPEQADPNLMRVWLTARLTEIRSAVAGLRADDIFVHTDAVETKITNGDTAGMEMDISAVIETLNAQNQAATKTVATVLGRGESGVNTASVESRIFALSAEQLNIPIADLLSQSLTLAIRLQGVDAYVEFGFERIELRPDLELEAQKTLRQARLFEQLSYGVIADDDFHLEMFNKIRPDNVPELSGTGFYQTTIDATDVSPNDDSLGRALVPEGSKAAKSNTNKRRRLAARLIARSLENS